MLISIIMAEIVYYPLSELLSSLRCIESKALLIQVQYRLDQLGIVRMKRAEHTLSGMRSADEENTTPRR
jgi:hypothetical protein